MYNFLVTLHVSVSLLLIGIILMQASKGGGLSGTFGGASTAMFGGRGAGSFLSKITIGLATFFLLLAILISIVNVPSNNTSSSIVKDRAGDIISPAADLPLPVSLPKESINIEK